MLHEAPSDASLGHTELEALKPLLALMKGQRNDAELSADAASCLAALVRHLELERTPQLDRTSVAALVVQTRGCVPHVPACVPGCRRRAARRS